MIWIACWAVIIGLHAAYKVGHETGHLSGAMLNLESAKRVILKHGWYQI